jgi:hypothetical protein
MPRLPAGVRSRPRTDRATETRALKLLDQVAQARSVLDIEDDTGRYLLPGAGAVLGALASCPTRFVADANVASYCRRLLETDRGMLVGRNEFLRLPTSRLWLEWPCEPSDDAIAGSRTGVFVAAGEDGRSGRLTTVWEQKVGEPVVAQMIASFDLDDDAMCQKARSGTWALRPGSHPLASHLAFELSPEWERHFSCLSDEAARRAASEIVANLLPGLEFVFAFCALLAERTCLSRHEIDLSRLNRQRQRKGNPALLNHMEVRLDISPGEGARSREAGGEREPARLHAVRGHMVHRSGHIFWRRSHLRGDASRSGWTRTVHVTRSTGEAAG